MRPAVVLIHSPSVGPRTWWDVAVRLRARGVEVVVPDLRHVTETGPPYWPRVADTVADAIGQLDGDEGVVLVPHSNAGLFVPPIADRSPHEIAGVVFVDAGLPAAGQPETPVAPPRLLDWLRTLADADGRLPRWTDWWDADDVGALLPDPAVRTEVIADQPRLPLDYYEGRVPVPPSWPATPCAYLRFAEAYAAEEETARAAGWPVGVLPGDHLHQVVDPDAVTAALLDLIGELSARAG